MYAFVARDAVIYILCRIIQLDWLSKPQNSRVTNIYSTHDTQKELCIRVEHVCIYEYICSKTQDMHTCTRDACIHVGRGVMATYIHTSSYMYTTCTYIYMYVYMYMTAVCSCMYMYSLHMYQSIVVYMCMYTYTCM